MRKRANDFDPIWRAGLWCPFRAHRLNRVTLGLESGSLSGKRFGGEGYMVCAPKGQKGLAQGFNPGLTATQKCALKVAPE